MLLKLLAIFMVIAVGWIAGRTGTLGPDAATVLTRVAFHVFTPAPLFRTTAGIAVARLPWTMLAAYFLPTLGLLIVVYGWYRIPGTRVPTAPAIRGLATTFSNTVQLGIPVVTALFGAAGVAVHVSIVSLQSLVLLTTGTVVAEIDLSRGADAERARASRVVAQTVRRSVVHPVVLPILLGLAYNATGLAIPRPLDDVLAVLSAGVVPVSLVAIGVGLHAYGLAGAAGPAMTLSMAKLLIHPAAVFAAAYWGFGLRGLPLAVAVMCAALPSGSNVLLFAARYTALQSEATAAIVASATMFAVTGSFWLLLLAHLPS